MSAWQCQGFNQSSAIHWATMSKANFWREFISLYEAMPVLWKVNSKAYRDKPSETECYDKLLEKLREIEPNADQETVKRKIRNLRINYHRELRKVIRSEKAENGEIYRPTLWYFKSMYFLRDEEIYQTGLLILQSEDKNALRAVVRYFYYYFF